MASDCGAGHDIGSLRVFLLGYALRQLLVVRSLASMSWPTARGVIVTLALLGLATVISGENALAQDSDDEVVAEDEALSADDMHAAVMTEDRFPSASVCGQCHPKQYREWSVSPHAYGQLSPVILSFQNATTKKVTSTVGDFCQRCHAPISAALGQRPEISALDRPLVARESITCIACHRVNQNFGGVSL